MQLALLEDMADSWHSPAAATAGALGGGESPAAAGGGASNTMMANKQVHYWLLTGVTIMANDVWVTNTTW